MLFTILFILIASCSDADQAQKALDDARKYAQNGDYEKALERHVWFHNNALKIRPSYYGVRLSFALIDWVRLGERYPKALETLKRIRDQKTLRLLSGEYDRELFHDVVSINDHLGDIEKTVIIFESFDLKNPKFAESVYDIASESLFMAEKFVIAIKYIGDPVERLESAKRDYLRGLDFANEIGNDDASRGSFERIFTDDVVQLIIILDKLGQRDSAEKIQALAIEIHDGVGIKTALKGINTEQSL